MKRILNLALALSLLLAVAGTAGAQQKSVRLVSLDWPPYIGSGLAPKTGGGVQTGFIAAIVTEAFRRGGYTLTIDFKPWTRAVDEATRGMYDGLFPEYYSSDRETDFVYSAEILGGPVGYLKKKTTSVTLRTAADLRNYRVGLVSGYIHLAELEADASIRKEEVSDDETGIRMLLANRFDLFEVDKYVAQHIINTKFAAQAGQLEFVEPARETLPLFIVFSKKATDYQAKLAAFNSGMAQLKQDGSVARIMQQYGF